MTRILVAVIYLVSLVTTSTAQVVGAAPRSTKKPVQVGNLSPQASNKDLQETLHEQVGAAVKKAEDQQDDTYWVNKGAAMVQKECSIRGMNCALEKLFEAEKAANGNVLKAVVCLKDGSECVPALAYGQGAVHYAIHNLLYYKGQIIVETSPQFVELVTNYGLHSEADRKATQKYFFALMQRAYKDCDKVSANEDTSRWNTRRTNYCAEEIGSMAVLAMLAKNDQERKQVASGVYSLMKSEYDSVGGGIIMTGGTVALGVLGTQDAYSKLERFLMDDTMPSTAGNVWEGINSPIKSTTQNSYKASRKDGRYLNRINEKFLYLDKQEAKRQGFSNTAWQSAGIQYPYANTLEDVGVLLGQQSAENGAAKRLATKIVQQANQYAKNGEQMAADVHYPVVVGIMDGWRQINNSMNIPSKELITLLYKGNWFDINEGTQRRVHRKAYEFGLRRNMVFNPPAKDQQKIKDYIAYAKAENAASVADVAAQFVLLDMVITKLPALAKGIPNAVRFLKQRSTWVGTKNFIRKLPRGSSVQKVKAGTKTVAKQPIKAATPKPATTAKPKAAQQTPKARPARQQARQTTVATTPKQSVKQPVATQTIPAAENAGAITRATGPKQPAVEPKTEAVSPTQLQEQVMGTLTQRVQEGKSATENIKAGAQYVGGLVQDYFKALVRPSNTLMMSIPGIPAPGTWQAVRAERLVQTSNFIKAEPLDAARRVAYYVGEDGKVAKQVISEKKYQKLVESATQSDTSTWASRQFKYRREMQALDTPTSKSGIEVGNRGARTSSASAANEKPDIEIVRRKQPQVSRTSSDAQPRSSETATQRAERTQKPVSEESTNGRKPFAEETRKAETIARTAESAAAGRTSPAAQKLANLSSQMEKGSQKNAFNEISENLNKAANMSLTQAQRARVKEAEQYFNQLTRAQINNWNALRLSPEFQKHAAVLRSPLATEHAFYVEGAGFENTYFVQSLNTNQMKGYIPTLVGEPMDGFVRVNLQNAFKTAERTNQPILVKLTTHGEISPAGKFYIPSRGLNKNIQIKTEELVNDLQLLRRTTGTPEVNLQLDACHSGQFLREFEALPKSKQAGINVYVHAGARQQENLVGPLAAAAGNRGTGSITSRQLEVLVKQIDNGNAFARGWVNGEAFNPLEQALWRAKSEGSRLADELQLLYRMQNADVTEINNIMAQYRKFNPRAGFSRASNFTDNSVKIIGDVRRYLTDTAQRMVQGQRWQEPAHSSGGFWGRLFGKK